MDGTTGRWLRILLIYLIGIFGMLVVSEAISALRGIAMEFHPRSPAMIGWVMSLPALAAVLSALIIGWIVDNVGDRRILLIGGAVMVAGDIGVVMAGDITSLLVWRLVSGFGYVGVVVAAVTMIVRVAQGRERVTALALWSTTIPASFVAASLYGLVTGGQLGWRLVFQSHAVGTVLLLALAWFLLPARPAGEKTMSRMAGIGAVLRSPLPYILGLSFAFAAFLQTGFVAALPHLLSERIGASVEQVHSFNILAMLCNIAGAFALGELLRRGVSAWIIGAGAVLLCAAAASALVIAPTALMPAMLMNCLLMLGLGVLVGMWALMPLVSPSPMSNGATSGLLTQITVLGVLFGPPSVFMAASAGVPGLLTFIAVAVVGSCIGWPVWLKSDAAAPPATAVAH